MHILCIYAHIVYICTYCVCVIKLPHCELLSHFASLYDTFKFNVPLPLLSRRAVSSQGLGELHAYSHQVLLCQALLQYQQGRYAAAASTFKAVEKAALCMGRATMDALAFRDAGAAANNVGVALVQVCLV